MEVERYYIFEWPNSLTGNLREKENEGVYGLYGLFGFVFVVAVVEV